LRGVPRAKIVGGVGKFRSGSLAPRAFLATLFVVPLPAQHTRPETKSAFTVLRLMLLPQSARPPEQLDRFVKALLRGTHLAKTVVGIGEFRIEVDGLLALLGRLFVVLLLAQRIRPVAQSVSTVLGFLLLAQPVLLVVVRPCLIWRDGH